MKSLTCFSSRSRGTCCAVILERLAENCRGRTTAIICTRTNAPKYILESHRLHFGSICDQNGRNFEPWCNGTRIPRNCQQVSGPSTVYHLVFTPILPFPYFNLTEECFSTWRWKVHNRPPHKQVLLLQAIWCMQWHHTRPMSGLDLPCQKIFFQDV